MNTNISITLSDEQRCRLANLLDNNVTKRKATRAEVKALVTDIVSGIVNEALPYDIEVNSPVRETGEYRMNPLTIVDPEDEEHLRGKSAGFIYGWNKVKKGHLKLVSSNGV